MALAIPQILIQEDRKNKKESRNVITPFQRQFVVVNTTLSAVAVYITLANNR